MIAITGAAGFIGSNLAHRLAAAGHRLWLVDRARDASRADHRLGLEDHRVSTELGFLDSLAAGVGEPIEAIFHLGACGSTTETDWDFLRRNNVEYSQHLWEWCARAGCPFYYASSAATYGDGSLGFSDRTPPELLTPLNLYGKSKNDFDRWALEQSGRGRLVPPAWAGLKFFNVYGPRESHKGSMASVVWHARRQLLESGEARLFRSNDPNIADGHQRRDFVFVEDCLDHLLWLWRNPQVSGIFNSGTGVARTFLDLARSVCVAMGQEPRIRFIDMPALLAVQYQNFTEADMTSLRGRGFSDPSTTLEKGVRLSLEAEGRIGRSRARPR